jgi:hypothetical protein
MKKKSNGAEDFPTEEVQKSENPKLVKSNIPEHLQEYASMGAVGFENVKASDTIVPRIAVAQAISPQVTKGDPSRIEGLEVGQFFNTVTEEIYGETVNVTPLLEFPSRIFFPPRGSNDPIRCSTKDLDADGRLINGSITPQGCDLCPYSKFGDDGTPPPCTLFYNYPVAVHTEGGLDPAVFSAKSKMIKPAKKLNSLVRYRKPPMPGFTMILQMGTVPQKVPKGTFYNITVQHAEPKDVPPHLIAQTRALYELMANRDINVDIKGIDKEDDFDAGIGHEDAF